MTGLWGPSVSEPVLVPETTLLRLLMRRSAVRRDTSNLAASSSLLVSCEPMVDTSEEDTLPGLLKIVPEHILSVAMS